MSNPITIVEDKNKIGMESKLEYSNLKINTGLKDEDFDPQKQL